MDHEDIGVLEGADYDCIEPVVVESNVRENITVNQPFVVEDAFKCDVTSYTESQRAIKCEVDVEVVAKHPARYEDLANILYPVEFVGAIDPYKVYSEVVNIN